MANLTRQLVRGYIWKARMFNGAVFEYWTPMQISRKRARLHLLTVADVYTSQDIDKLWQTKG